MFDIQYNKENSMGYIKTNENQFAFTQHIPEKMKLDTF